MLENYSTHQIPTQSVLAGSLLQQIMLLRYLILHTDGHLFGSFYAGIN